MIASIRLQPAGTWLPLRVKRGDDDAGTGGQVSAQAMRVGLGRTRSGSSCPPSWPSLPGRSEASAPSLDLDVELDPGTRHFRAVALVAPASRDFRFELHRIADGDRRFGGRQGAARRSGRARRTGPRLARAASAGHGHPASGIWRNAARARPQSRRSGSAARTSADGFDRGQLPARERLVSAARTAVLAIG